MAAPQAHVAIAQSPEGRPRRQRREGPADWRAEPSLGCLALCPLQSCMPRWQTCISNTDDALGFALGSLFVKATFDRQSKEIVSLQGSSNTTPCFSSKPLFIHVCK